jgi:hypothetical protein
MTNKNRKEEREKIRDINDDLRALVIKIKAVIDDERVSEDEGIALDTRKVERVRQLLVQFYNIHGAEMETYLCLCDFEIGM